MMSAIQVLPCVYAGAGDCRNADTIAALSDELAACNKMCNQAYGNTAAAFSELVNISLLTPLQGEVDDYAAVTREVHIMYDELQTLRKIYDPMIENSLRLGLHNMTLEAENTELKRQLAALAAAGRSGEERGRE